MTAKPPPLPPRQRASVTPPPPIQRHSGTPPEPTLTDVTSTGPGTTLGRISQVPRPAPTAVPPRRESVPDSSPPQTIRAEERQDTEPVSSPPIDDLVWDESDLANAASYSPEPRRNSSVPPISEQLATNPGSAPPSAEPATIQPPAPVTQDRGAEAHAPTDQNRTAAPDAKRRIEEFVTNSANRASSPFAVAGALAVAVILILLEVSLGAGQVGTVVLSSIACIMVFLIHFTLMRTRTEFDKRLHEMQQLLQHQMRQTAPADHRERDPLMGASEWGSDRSASSSDAYDLRRRDSSAQDRTAFG